jgi:very-short-patch-repair endonuclease
MNKGIEFSRRLRKDQTEVEKILWQRLRAKQLCGFKFRRQHPIGKFIVDFVCLEKNLVIELDGGQHDIQRNKDGVRDQWLKDEGFRVLRFWNNEVNEKLEAVLEKILAEVTASSR